MFGIDVNMNFIRNFHVWQASEGVLAIKKIVGLEIDEVAARRGAKRLCTRHLGIFERPSAPELEVYLADVACESASRPGYYILNPPDSLPLPLVTPAYL